MTGADDRWLLPAGIEEILPPAAARLERARRRLIDLYATWGYELVMPPFIEYLESLLTGTGSDLDLETFKLIDQLTGRSMGVRADMTPQVARIDAHSLRRAGPTRLCYLGTVLRTRPDGFAGSRAPLQVGAELYGHAGIESDCEILGLLLETLRAVGVAEVHLDVGHVGVFRSLARAAGVGPPLESDLFDALQRKDHADLESLLAGARVDRAHARRLAALGDLNGGIEVLAAARAALEGAPAEALAALDALEALAVAMTRRVPRVPLYFDLAELRGYGYHTGVVFAAFVPGHGQEIARGGRYDHIGEVFGRARPATGFTTDLKTLVALGEADADDAGPRGVFAPWADDGALLALVERLRGEGERVVNGLPGQVEDARTMGCDRHLVRRDGQWRVETLGR